MRRFVPALLLALAALPPLLGCDLLKGKSSDAGLVVDEAGVATTPTAAPTAPADPAAPGVTTAAPLSGPTVAPNGQPIKRADGGVVVGDAGKSDAAPAPQPGLPQFPGFDAGAFRGFDAGGLPFKIPDGGFKF